MGCVNHARIEQGSGYATWWNYHRGAIHGECAGGQEYQSLHICQIHFVVPESVPSPNNVTVNCHHASVFQQQVEIGGA